MSTRSARQLFISYCKLTKVNEIWQSIQGSLPERTHVLKYGRLLSTLPTNMTLKYEETVCLEKETVKEAVSQKLEDNRRSVASFLGRFF